MLYFGNLRVAHKWHYRCKPGFSLLLKMVFYCLVSEDVIITNVVFLVSGTYLYKWYIVG